MNNPIVLIGFKAVGKTTIGRILAEKWNLEWFDTDKELEEKFGEPVKKIFVRLGEQAFRQQEIKILDNLLKSKNLVISTGGGIVEHPQLENMLLKTPCFKIHLHLPFSKILERIQEKPVFLGDTCLESIYRRRLPLYQKVCDIEIDVSNRRENHGE